MLRKISVRCQDCKEKKVVLVGIGITVDTYVCNPCISIRKEKVRDGVYTLQQENIECQKNHTKTQKDSH